MQYHTANNEVCIDCKSSLITLQTEAKLVCPSCGITQDHMDISASTIAYGEEVEYSSFQYRRITHFNDLLTNIQYQESARVPKTFINKVMQCLLDEGYRNGSSLTFMIVNRAIRKLGIRRYYKHTMQIFCEITKQPPLRIKPQTEEILRLMFLTIQEPWERHCPDTRKNFFSYPYCLYKLAQLIDQTNILPYLCLLKCHKKLDSQEDTFRKICLDLGWPFISIS